MQCGETSYTNKEAERLLNADGFERGTDEFTEEFDRRFLRSETDETRFVERVDWQPRAHCGTANGGRGHTYGPHNSIFPERYPDRGTVYERHI